MLSAKPFLIHDSFRQRQLILHAWISQKKEAVVLRTFDENKIREIFLKQMGAAASADSLTVTSRQFYERAKIKTAFSIFLAAYSLMLLGFCSTAGGLSASNEQLYTHAEESLSTEEKRSYQALVSGYGFACFTYILGSILVFCAAIYISPPFTGTANEKKILRNPQEIDLGTYSSESPMQSAYTSRP